MEIVLGFLLRGLQVSAPIAFASLGGLFSERSGVVNIGLEGTMLMSTFAVVWGSLLFESYLGGLLFALIAGMLMASIHAVVTVTYKVDHIVSGVAINVLALGFTR
ncbi:MAG: ABC transporter permease subunit, partial [Spirochaetota bacterium]